MTTTETSHKARVHQELAKAGMTKLGFMKPSSRYLYRMVHADEHIMGVVFTAYGWDPAILVATDKRLIYFAHEPLYTTSDEVTYDAVSGVKSFSSGPLASVTLHTRIQDYTLRYVNKRAATKFAKYIEQHRIELYGVGGYPPMPMPISVPQSQAEPEDLEPLVEPAALAFLTAHDAGVLSTVDRTGNVHGATVYYKVGDKNELYILTRSETTKARNVLAHQQVALTIYDEDPPRTMQIQGYAEVVTEQPTKDHIYAEMIQPRKYKKGTHLPPVAAVKAGVYVVLRILPTNIAYRPYQSGEEE